ncbi:MAG TPA: DJ-1/PfpI family protein [Pseudomonadales bacterium]|nr:DJ-1/PfpI family protein [Pseudomonadales bacterium]
MSNRRSVVRGLGTAAMLAPLLAGARGASAATESHATPAKMSDEHMQAMRDVLGPNWVGREQVAMLLYPGFTALDLVGPQYFFACMYGATVHLVTTEPTLAPVKSDLGLAIVPTVTMADAPRDLDILFVGGGTQGTLDVMQRADVIAFLADRGARAKHVCSVCTGSMVLGQAGLLKGKRATSHWVARSVLPEFGATPVDARVVTDGNVTTAAGVSAGLDFGIAVVESLRGKPYAAALMLQAEYHPQPPFPGGTLATTDAAVGGMMDTMMAPLAEQFRVAARGGV